MLRVSQNLKGPSHQVYLFDNSEKIYLDFFLANPVAENYSDLGIEIQINLFSTSI
jgi:hypothetical protein